MAARTDYVKAPCGCEFWNEGEAFVMKPCAPDCALWQYAEAEAERQDKPMEYRMENPGG